VTAGRTTQYDTQQDGQPVIREIKETTKNLHTTAWLQAGIWTKDLPNSKQNCHQNTEASEIFIDNLQH